MGASAHRITMAEARLELDALAERARSGETFSITSNGEVVAELGPPGRRRVGCMRGTLTVTGDDLMPTIDEWPDAP